MENKKYYAVEYAGFWRIQEGRRYNDLDILDAENVGAENAKNNAELIVKLLNEHEIRRSKKDIPEM